MLSTIFGTFCGLTFGGTRQARPGEEQRALSLWRRYCEGGNDGGVDSNGNFIHCKHPLTSKTSQTRTLTARIGGGRTGKDKEEQYIFVQPPTLHFNHKINLDESGFQQPKTIVYVQPAKTSHSYTSNIDSRKEEAEHVKPELVFLSDKSNGNDAENETSEPQG